MRDKDLQFLEDDLQMEEIKIFRLKFGASASLKEYKMTINFPVDNKLCVPLGDYSDKESYPFYKVKLLELGDHKFYISPDMLEDMTIEKLMNY